MNITEYTEAVLNNDISIKTMVSNTLKRKSLNYFIDKMKTHFGIEMKFSNDRQNKIITKWVEISNIGSAIHMIIRRMIILSLKENSFSVLILELLSLSVSEIKKKIKVFICISLAKRLSSGLR